MTTLYKYLLSVIWYLFATATWRWFTGKSQEVNLVEQCLAMSTVLMIVAVGEGIYLGIRRLIRAIKS